MKLIEFTDKGLFCPQASAYIDPCKSVDKAIITHAHSDHARPGHKMYISSRFSVPALKLRLGNKIVISGVDYGESFAINGVKFSFHPAGHIIGSAQVRVEYKGEVWVVSGDYKREDDLISGSFELVKCHNFITESTFGLPIFNWQKQEEVFFSINNWWASNASLNIPSVINVYALGKAQRILTGLNAGIGPIYAHPSVENTNEVFRKMGFDLPLTKMVSEHHKVKDFSKAIILSPGSMLQTAWAQNFKEAAVANISGWMALNKMRKTPNIDAAFALSDHADWTALNNTVAETGAENVFVTHGYTKDFSKWLRYNGYNASIVESAFHQDLSEND